MASLIVSNIVLWVIVIGLILTVLALARQVGILYERITPVGALTMDHGPKVGEPAPQFTLDNLTGGSLTVGRATGRRQLLFFLAPGCPVCKKLLPILRSLRSAERATLDVTLASDGDMEQHRSFYHREKLAPFPYVLSTDLGMTYRISKLPYAVMIGPEGRISAKGLVNTREQIESLLQAAEMGVGSLQDYMSRTERQEG
ncbi:MAG: methylamine dehydrogenase accessory protein MauD [Steroidobacteraceae bacterium]|jgi:methylamine dehydrogenase accessory protein MauD